MQEQNELLIFQSWQLEEQLDTICYFLSSVHPNLIKKDDGYRPCVEIRPINRGEEDFMLSKSLMLWDLEPSSVERLKTFLTRHNGYPTCLFYSVFNYDNLKQKNGKTTKSSRIHTAAALSTDEIALDFDDISHSDYIELVDRFEAMGLYAMWVFSGHGYQAHILLDKSLEDKNILRSLVYKFRSKGFNCDPACVDPARLMRLPYTYNCKCFKDNAYDGEEPPFCKILQQTNSRYSLDYLLSELDKLPTVSKVDEEVLDGEGRGLKKKAAPVTQPDVDPDSFSLKKVEYPFLSNFDLPEAVDKMLAYTPHGVRNKVLGYLIRLFKTQYKLSKNQIMEILSIWSKEACDPVYPSDELKTDFSRLYYEYNGLGYDAALVKLFGPVDSQKLITLRKKDIFLPSAFFKDFNTLDGKTVRLYLAIKMLEHIDEPATIDKLSELLGISDRALRPTIQDLVKSGHGFVKKGNRRMKEPDVYCTHRGYSLQDGYVTYSYNDIKAYVTELYEKGSRAHGELKLYLYMRWKFYSGDIFMSQTKLGENINVAQNTISDIVHRLEEKHFIKIVKVKRYNCFDSCEYNLLR